MDANANELMDHTTIMSREGGGGGGGRRGLAIVEGLVVNLMLYMHCQNVLNMITAI